MAESPKLKRHIENLKILEMSYGSLIASYGSLIASNGNPIASNCIVWQSTRHQGPRPPRPKVPRPKAPGPRHQAQPRSRSFATVGGAPAMETGGPVLNLYRKGNGTSTPSR